MLKYPNSHRVGAIIDYPKAMEKSTRDHITDTKLLIDQTAAEVDRLREMIPSDKLEIARLKVFLEQQREMLEGFEELTSPGASVS